MMAGVDHLQDYAAGNGLSAGNWFTAEETGDFSQEHPCLSLEDSVKNKISKTLEERNMHFRFKAVEEVMAPLIYKVTSLTEMKAEDSPGGTFFQPRRYNIGNPIKLVQLVDKAMMNLVVVGEDIAEENPDYKNEILLACEDILSKGEILNEAASLFIRDTCRSERRAVMVDAAREILFSVTRLMVIADIVDVNNLLSATDKIEDKLRSLQDVRSEAELVDKIKDCTSDIARITQFATLRQNETKSKTSLQLLTAAQTDLNRASETKSKTSLQLLTAAQTDLNRASVMLVSASKAFLHNPTEKAAEENRELIIGEMLKSLKTLSLLANGEEPYNVESYIGNSEPGELAIRFANFERHLEQLGANISRKVSSSLQKDLDSILKSASELAVSGSTRDYRQHTIITQSDALKSELQCLMDVANGREDEDERAKKEILTLTRQYSTSLKRELHRASVDHVSDAFVDALAPLNDMVKAAQDGERVKVDELAGKFDDHAKNMLKAALISCSLSKDIEGIQMVKMAAKHISALIPQVIRAAQTLVAQPASNIPKKNMEIFKETWMENVMLLTSSVDAISPLIDFMFVTEAHIREDGYVLEEAVEDKDKIMFDQTVSLACGRCSRFAYILKTEMKENPAHYSAEQRDKITSKIQSIERKSIKVFQKCASKMGENIGDPQNNTEQLRGTLEKVVEEMRDLCREVLTTRTPEEQERVGSDLDDLLHPPRPLTPTPSSILSPVSSTSSLDSATSSTPIEFKRTPRHSSVFDSSDSSQTLLSQLSTQQQAQLVQASEGFTAQQEEFESAAKKWDLENDIVLMAKEMCMMLMDMSNFTRGIGSLHTLTDLVVTAKDIARAGEYLCTLARVIADRCPDTKSKNDLYAYVDRIKLYCHQLKITSAVKAETRKSTDETVDSASALMTAAKNLMNAVVETVKTSYIASSAIIRMQGGTMTDQFAQWRLTMPGKKNLESPLGASKEPSAPIHQLGLFRPNRD